MQKIKILFIVSIAVLFASCGGDNNEAIDSSIIHAIDGEKPVLSFDETRIEFGTLTTGDKITRTVRFTNTGDADLIITRITSACGCTVVNDWPKDPVKPGEKGSFTINFDSTGKEGQIVKKIKVEANTNPSISVCAIAGYVKTDLN